jgi:phosphopantothenoylcysteine decarboxylase/phosphopantothenate--cysteine ligase
LVSGPSNLADPAGVKTVRIQTALEMQAAVQAAYDKADAVIMSAAVADYRPKTVAKDKIKKSDDELVLHLERNPDILYGLGQQKDKQILVGFAAETCNVEEYAKKKLSKKNLDFIVANDVSAKDAGFAVDNNRVQIYTRAGGCEKYPLMSKQELAGIILNKIAELMS